MATKHKASASIRLAALLALALPGLSHSQVESLPLAALEEVVVTSQRREQPLLQHAGNIFRLGQDGLDWIEAHHVHELLNRVPGGWVARGSGQEHQTAIRSPVLGGGGACGGFLPLEEGIPVRPSVFCNINQFIDLYTEEARAIEVVRGPGSALYGSNALHGTVNVLMPEPGRGFDPSMSLETGSNGYFRGSMRLGSGEAPGWVVAGTYTHDGGFREDSGYDQGKLHLKRAWLDGEDPLMLAFTATRLDQQSAGFIEGLDAYRDPEINRSNPDPEAFREASSQRLYGLWSRSFGAGRLEIRPFLRHSDMEFMHYERPGKPIEENGHHSAGTMITFSRHAGQWFSILGLDVDWSESWLQQTQAGPAEGGPRQRAIFPQGKHYDYRVRALGLAAYSEARWEGSDRWSLGLGARLEYTRLDYDNRMISGNTRDDGTPCDFGGCVYSRPEDRTDAFLDLAPNLSLTWRQNESLSYFARLARGYRVPQALELYRLQNGQLVSDLDTETLDSLEAGFRRHDENWLIELAAYTMRKRDGTFVDAEGFNVSGARSRHHGLEILLNWQLTQSLALDVNGAYGRHRYDFDARGRGSVFVAGNDIDSAPRWLGSAELRYDPDLPVRFGLEINSLGEYYLDSLNRFRYPGHALLTFRMAWDLARSCVLTLRINNLADRAVADRADYAQGDYRYLPGRGREWFLNLRWSIPERRLP